MARRARRRPPWRGLFLALVGSLAHGDEPRVDFRRDVQPIFAAHCVGCHGPTKQKGGLRLDRKDAALDGGDAAAIVPGKGAESPVVELAGGADPDRVMPPEGPRLGPEQVATLRRWIDQGADWPDEVGATAADDFAPRRDWWSLRPLIRPAVPALTPADAARARGPIDAFIADRLRREGLEPAPEADRRTLIRRVSFDLVGLPPTPAEVAAFVADPDPDAYEKLVDRLLASPRHGERWARHWLDVVHYGDSHGYDKDKPRPNAWPYRDYVIRAFNEDKPYARFVQEQVAGDVLEPVTADGVVATGFLAAGPWDFIGHAEVPETKLDGKTARHLDRDDMAGNTFSTFMGLTVSCAQCHDHKFDPVRQEEYYRLQAVFAALDRADRPFYADPAASDHAARLMRTRDALRRERAAIDARVLASPAGAEVAALDVRLAQAALPPRARPEFGYHSALESGDDAAKWVQVDLGQSVALDRVVIWGAYDDFNNIGAGFGFPRRYRVELGDDPHFAGPGTVLLDRTDADQPNPGTAPQAIPAGGRSGRYIRFTATKLAPRQGDYHLALAEIEIFDAAGTNRATGAKVVALDSIEAPPRWGTANLTDGKAPGRDLAREDPAPLHAQRRALIARDLGDPVAADRDRVTADHARAERELAGIRPTGQVYAATVFDGGRLAAFRGTGADGGSPRPIFLLHRGDIRHPGREVAPGVPAVGLNFAGGFDLPAGHAEGDRRLALARWLTDRDNPLTWRAIVNRVWQGHFGRAIAATPGDLGRMGSPPSHPELLDWLAAEFRDGGQSLKALHRAIVLSSTYRQSSAGSKQGTERDADNVWLGRMNRRKLEAEAVRDAALFVAGTLDTTMGGPPFRDFVIERPEHSPHYQYEQHDPDDPRARRRAIYRFLARSRPEPLMAALDCADPSMRVDRRDETLSPLQALALLNNGLMLATSRHMAGRFADHGGVAAAFEAATGRPATAAEIAALEALARDHGLPQACRVILNLNEFAFVD